MLLAKKNNKGRNLMSHFNWKYINKNPVTLTHKKVTRTDKENNETNFKTKQYGL